MNKPPGPPPVGTAHDGLVATAASTPRCVCRDRSARRLRRVPQEIQGADNESVRNSYPRILVVGGCYIIEERWARAAWAASSSATATWASCLRSRSSTQPGAAAAHPRRLYREARMAAAMSHPASCRSSTSASMRSTGRHRHGLPGGETLAGAPRAGGASSRPRRPAISCCSAPSGAALHPRPGVIHCDIKPENVFCPPQQQR